MQRINRHCRLKEVFLQACKTLTGYPHDHADFIKGVEWLKKKACECRADGCNLCIPSFSLFLSTIAKSASDPPSEADLHFNTAAVKNSAAALIKELVPDHADLLYSPTP